VSQKPVIGLYLELRSDGSVGDDARYPSFGRWIECIRRSGGIPTLIPPLDDELDVGQQLDYLQGFVYVRQRDLGTPHAGWAENVADEFVMALVRQMAHRQLPFLGVGGGMQVLNVAMGGSTIRLDRLRPRVRHIHPHNPRHTVKFAADSLLERIWGSEPMLVTSAHEAVVGHVAPGFRPTAFAHDLSVEGIESTDRSWFAVGVQFEPEPDAIADAGGLLVEALLDEARVHELELVAACYP